jgi:acetoin utilization deacetylase AcuC-like enzyme
MKVKVVYSEKQVADTGQQPISQIGYTASPSANKPRQVAAALRETAIEGLEIEFVEPVALTVGDFKMCHSDDYVDGVMSLRLKNGFGTISQSVVDSLPYTNGAQYTAARLATVDSPTCALVSGFHHAGYDGWEKLGWFCTFNGLLIAAAKLVAEDGMKKVAIIDCDMHYGNGTTDILEQLPELAVSVEHLTFGRYFDSPKDAEKYLAALEPDGRVEQLLKRTKPDLVIYQSGADVHVDDPYGGVLTTEQMYERDLRMFRIAKRLDIPLTWNLAGGYQVEADGSIAKVLGLHLNTFKACQKVYGS